MNCIELAKHQHHKFLEFLGKQATYDIGLLHTATRLSIHIKTDKESIITPGTGEFTWVWRDNTYFIKYIEEGVPIFNSMTGSITYFKRLTIQHDNLMSLKEFVECALSYEDSLDSSKFQVMHSRHTGYWESGSTSYAQTIDNIYIPESLKTSVIKHIDDFIASSDRYIKFGRSYKLCFLLTGCPGSGKTSLVKAITIKYKRPLYVLSLSKKLEDEGLIDLVHAIKDNSILLLEDIDAFFVDRRAESINVSFSALINVIDGTLAKANGLIVFLTANNPNMLDPALIRPGRVDRIVEFDYPRRAEILTAFEKLVNVDVDANMIDGISKNESFTKFYNQISGKGMSMSAIIDYLFRHPTDYMENIELLLDSTKSYQEIISNKTEKMFN